MTIQTITEDFLHYVWKFGCFNSEELFTTNQQKVHILNRGIHNFDAGPDFSNAKILIDDTQWIGNVEIHINSSDWDKHKHSQDPSYASVILHVVHCHDKEIPFLSQQNIPTIELKELIHSNVFENYLTLRSSGQKILCADQISLVPSMHVSSMLEKTAIERLSNKAKEIDMIFKFTKMNWEESFYILLAKYYGASVNTQPFERLAKSISLKWIEKLKDDPLKIEALFFGQSSLLPSVSNDPYVKQLIEEYNFQKQKFKLKALNVGVWKFSRMRPSSFPTLRIALFSALLVANEHLFSQILNFESLVELKAIFDVNTQSYWDLHYQFNKESTHRIKKLGAKSVEMLLINAVVPMLFFHGWKTDNQVVKDKALWLLENLSTEKNRITQSWHEIGVIPKNALDSQGQIELKRSYCDLKRCVECSIGHQIIKKD